VIWKVVKLTGGNGALRIDSEMTRISNVFRRLGGSWTGFFKGSIDDVTLLKKVVRFAMKKGYVTKSSE